MYILKILETKQGQSKRQAHVETSEGKQKTRKKVAVSGVGLLGNFAGLL
jgi:hypothetical protein